MSPVDGEALRERWDATCEHAVATVDAVLPTTSGSVASYRKLRRNSVLGTKHIVDGRLRAGLVYRKR